MNKFAGNRSPHTGSILSTKVPLIGELLLAANVIKLEYLNESLQIAKTSKAMIGRTLIMLGQIDEHKLHAALELQTLIRNGAVNTQVGIKALGIACHSRVAIEEALTQLGWQAHAQPETDENSLAKLVIDSGLISKQILEIVEQQSKENNLPIGRCLVVNRHISQNILEDVLCTQSLVKDNHITQAQAIEALKASLQKRQPLEQSLIGFGIRALSESDRRIGDILCLAGLITEVSKLTALEKSITENIPIADVLIQTEMITTDLLDKALTLQTHILSDYITLGQAADILRRSQAEGLDLDKLLEPIKAKGQTVNQVEQLLNLLIGTGYLNNEIIVQARQTAKAEGKNLGEVILSEQKIDQAYIDAAWQAQKMIDARMMSFKYACTELRKMTGQNKDFQQGTQEALQQSYDNDASIESAPSGTWLTRLRDKFFNRKFR